MTTPISIAVVGAHLEGQPLHHQLTSRGAGLVQRTTTAPSYRMYALATEPPKPGLVRVADGGGAVEVEVWALEPEGFATFVAGENSPYALIIVPVAAHTSEKR